MFWEFLCAVPPALQGAVEQIRYGALTAARLRGFEKRLRLVDEVGNVHRFFETLNDHLEIRTKLEGYIRRDGFHRADFIVQLVAVANLHQPWLGPVPDRR